jgi:hypothetical protein
MGFAGRFEAGTAQRPNPSNPESTAAGAGEGLGRRLDDITAGELGGQIHLHQSKAKGAGVHFQSIPYPVLSK